MQNTKTNKKAFFMLEFLLALFIGLFVGRVIGEMAHAIARTQAVIVRRQRLLSAAQGQLGDLSNICIERCQAHFAFDLRSVEQFSKRLGLKKNIFSSQYPVQIRKACLQARAQESVSCCLPVSKAGSA